MGRKSKTKGQGKQAMLPVMRPDAAGIDIGATEIFVAVPADRAVENVRSFPTFTQDLYALADWLAQCRVKTVAMGIDRSLLDSPIPDLGRAGVRSVPGQRATREECARPADGCVGLPVVAVLTFGGITARVLPARARGVCRAFLVAAPREPGTDGRHACQSDAEIAGPNEFTTASRNQRYHRPNRTGDRECDSGGGTESPNASPAAK